MDALRTELRSVVPSERRGRARERRALLCLSLVTLLLTSSCALEPGQERVLPDQVSLTILHTSDWHSRLLPYDMDVIRTDRNLGLLQENGPFGGVARMMTVIERERARSERAIYLDSGDCFQGAPIFNVFRGAVEIKVMSLLRPDGVALGNHEFDEGVERLAEVLADYGTFPMLAANYSFRSPLLEPRDPTRPQLRDHVQPFHIVNRDGLRIGIIGVANFSSLSSITFGDNGIGIIPIDSVQVVQQYIDLLRPIVDLLVVTSHAGLGEDEHLIRNTRGLDVLMGGHLHVVLDPPRVLQDLDGRDVILSHGGAFTKYVTRLDLNLERDPEGLNGYEVRAHTFEVIPIDARIPDHPAMTRLLEPYVLELSRQLDLSQVIAYAPRRLMRFGVDGGDSPLGNIVADSIRYRNRVEAQFAATNSLGIRADLPQGPVTLEQMYNVFPFPNSITTLKLSGNEVQEFLNTNARRSAGRGCATQLQVSGISFTLDCSGASPRDAVATNILIDGEPIAPDVFYELASNDYIARGGSGFRVLRFNTTQRDTGVPLRDATIDWMKQFPSCGERCTSAGLDENSCAILGECRRDVGTFRATRCRGLDAQSDQELCLAELAPRCLQAGVRRRSDFALCVEADPAVQACRERFREADRLACLEEIRPAAEAGCEGRDRVSPREACARNEDAGICLELDPVSALAACAERAERDAELLCVDLPCLVAESEGRINRRLPQNKSRFLLEEQAGLDAAEFMDFIQAEHNDEACY